MKDMVEKSLKISKCIDCPHHKVIGDPDPHDWFCDDDQAIVCTKVLKEESDIKKDSLYVSDRQQFRCVDIGCRPYQIKNVEIPDWCPL
jgi:hypothetical protein